MKHLLRLSFFLFAAFLFAQPVSALVLPSSTEPAKTAVVSPSPFAGMTLKDFMTFTPKKYAALTGKKMTFSQKWSLKMAQHKLKKQSKGNDQALLYALPSGIDTSDFNIGGFVLGLLLPVIGVLIAYLIGDTEVIKWAWIGFAVWAAIFLLILIL